MTDNPLKGPPGAGRPGRVTVDMLRSHAFELNRQKFIIATGKLYHVAVRCREDGTAYHVLDRDI